MYHRILLRVEYYTPSSKATLYGMPRQQLNGSTWQFTLDEGIRHGSTIKTTMESQTNVATTTELRFLCARRRQPEGSTIDHPDIHHLLQVNEKAQQHRVERFNNIGRQTEGNRFLVGGGNVPAIDLRFLLLRLGMWRATRGRGASAV